jgi:Tol biopolymer transport system component
MTWVDRSGTRVGTIGEPDALTLARISPDQQRVAFIVGTETAGRAWVMRLDGSAATLITENATTSSLAWAPDSTRLVLNDASPASRLYVTTLPDRPRLGLAPTGRDLRVNDWSADGRWIVYEQDGQQKQTDLWIMAVLSEGTPVPAAFSEGKDRDADFSPNNRWMVYASDKSGRSEIVAQTFPVSSPPIRLSHNGGTAPRWGHDGREIFYESLDGELMVVQVSFEPGLIASQPRALFALRGSRFQQVAADGRFLVLMPVAASGPPR